jgi:hypothetical protein
VNLLVCVHQSEIGDVEVSDVEECTVVKADDAWCISSQPTQIYIQIVPEGD